VRPQDAPPRLRGPPQTRGPNQGRTFDLDQLVRDCGAAMGWDPDSGIPTPETLSELGLDPVPTPS
jgi:aldehyde:ferredoxin oxidoreductase